MDSLHSSTIHIGNRELSLSSYPWIIAEMSANHNGNLDRALAIIDSAAQAGARAVKLQTYTPDTMTLDVKKKGFVIESASLWQGRSLYDLYEEAQTPWGWHKVLFDRCKEKGIIGFSSPFDETAVELLESLNVPCYKVASLEILDHGLLKAIAGTKKTIFMSTGASFLYEVEEAMDVLAKHSSGPVILLKCTSAYPTPFDQANLRTISHLQQYFGCLVGLSDHTAGIETSIAAVALGAVAIEKHFTLSRGDGGVDAAFSLEPEELKQLVVQSGRVWQAMGSVFYGATQAETVSHALRRSLYVTQDVKKGDPINRDNVRAIRPGAGLSPKYFDEICNDEFSQNVSKGTPMSLDLVKIPKSPVSFLNASAKCVVAVVQARMGSTRLPGKVLMPLGKRSMLEWIVQRLRLCKKLHDIVVATSVNTLDNYIVELCERIGVKVVRGSEDDVLGRFILAAQTNHADAIVRITGDCPFVDPQLVDDSVDLFQMHATSCHLVSNTVERTFPRGLDVEVISFQALQDLNQSRLSDAEREHVTLGLYRRPAHYKRLSLQGDHDYAHFRWTVDSALDYGYALRVYQSLEEFFEQMLQKKDQKTNVKYPWMQGTLNFLAGCSWSHLNALEHQKRSNLENLAQDSCSKKMS